MIDGLSESDLAVKINAPLFFVHNNLIETSKKIEWVPDLKEVKNSTPVNRINSTHKCIFENKEIDFLTINNHVKKDEIVYSEKVNSGAGITFITDYKLRSKEGGTNIYARFRFDDDDFSTKSFFTRIKYFFIEKKLRGITKKSMKLFKAYCENKFTG